MAASELLLSLEQDVSSKKEEFGVSGKPGDNHTLQHKSATDLPAPLCSRDPAGDFHLVQRLLDNHSL